MSNTLIFIEKIKMTSFTFLSCDKANEFWEPWSNCWKNGNIIDIINSEIIIEYILFVFTGGNNDMVVIFTDDILSPKH